MVSIANDAMNALRRAHGERPGTVDLGLFLSHYPELGDDELADLIELDARERLRAGMKVELSRYLGAIPELAARRVALDAAIEFALRSLSGSRHTTVEAVEALCAGYPELVPAISAAWFLNDALGSTTGGSVAAAPLPEVRLPMSVGPQLQAGRARYELRERVGVGSHAAVYLAVDHALSEPDRPAWVAVKIASVAPGAHAVSLRVVEEATKARRVTHPNIARVLDRGTLDAGREFVVYEHVDGGDLQDAFDRGKLPRDHRSLVKLVAKVARAVQAAHAAGLIHSDLKPSNVLLTSAGEPKVADFGLAARRFDIDEAARRVQLGTLGYIAPERYRAEPGSESTVSDVYSLGGILYLLLTGKPPNGSTPDEVTERLGADPESAAPPPLVVEGGKIDADLAAVCARALAPRAAERYASADALANDLEAWLEHRPISWRKVAPERAAWLFLRRNPAVAGVMLASLLCAVVGTIIIADVHYSQTQRRLSAQLDNAKKLADQQAEHDNEARRVIGTFMRMMKEQRDPLSENWIPFITVVESVSGPVLFDVTGSNKELDAAWSSRIEVAQRVVDDAARADRQKDSETLLWRVGLGFWQLRAKRFDEAAKVLSSAAADWTEVRGPGDTWSRYSAALAACARVRGVLAAAEEGTLTEGDEQVLSAGAKELEGDLTFFVGHREGNAVHREVLRALEQVYSSEPLLDPAKKSEYHEGLRRLLERRN